MKVSAASEIRLVSDVVGEAVKSEIARPVYLEVTYQPDGKLVIKRVEFITPEQLAEIARVKPRTVYLWIEKAAEIGLRFYRAPGSRQVLFEINETLDWIKGSGSSSIAPADSCNPGKDD